MAKQLNVNLAFTADTGQAKAELKSLQSSLQNLVNVTALNSNSFNFTSDIQKASAAAAQLKAQLQAATNVNTGNLDLSRFQDQMQKSGMSLEKYQNALYQLGPAGEKAFADLSRSITLAEVPLRRTSGLVNNLWTTLKNTARWQLSSSMLHGFMGTVQSAYGYAQDLNESLNNIRIVTGQNTEQMAEFAENANRAAKALSTTTTAYTNAALIYYQQGDNDQTVLEKTDVTAKMANVTGQSAEIVSDQLTAIWNNFNKSGEESYEKYADVLTALGAATASSTDEIAGGLEKFASIADMIGLSYDYAATALATITATTRQSEEVVGTALKTIFARIQGLSLGETLDDGTNLNKYSEALSKVGISIFEQNGELKEMDSILDEMGAKWTTLSKDQQVALAQTVAGVRQYNQLVSLMDNWDYFGENLQIAQGAEGTLDEQAEIYAESWDAASKRVRASAEAIYEALLNDDFFIDLNNNFADLLDGIKVFIDGMGGVKGVLLSIGAIITRVFQKQIAESLSNAAYSIKMISKTARENELKSKQTANNLLISGAKDVGTTSGGYKAEVYASLGKNQLSYIENSKKMSQEEQVINQMLMDRNRLLADEVIKKGENVQKLNEEIAIERKHLAIQAQIAAQNNSKVKTKDASNLTNKVKSAQQEVENITKNYRILETLSSKMDLAKGVAAGSESFKNLKTHIQNVVKELAGVESLKTKEEFSKLAKALGLSRSEATQLWQALEKTNNVHELDVALTNLATTAGAKSAKAIEQLRQSLINCTGDADKADALMKDYLATLDRFGPESVEASEALLKLKQAIAGHNAEMDKAKTKPLAFSTAITQASSALMSFGQIINQIRGIIDVFNDSEATAGDKILALVTGIGMLVPAAMSIVPAFGTAEVAIGAFGATASIAMWQLTLIVVAIAAVAGAIAFLVTQQSKEEKAAKKAIENAEKLAEAHNNAKDALEDLKSSFDAYDTAVEALEACTEGTEEWKNALEDVNETVLDLLNTYPDLLKDAELFNRNADGMLEINEAKRESLLEQAENRVKTTQAASLFGEAHASEANVNLERKNLSSSIGSTGIGDSRSVQGSTVYDQYLNVGKILTDNALELANLTETEYRQKVSELLHNAASDQVKSSANYNAQIDALIEKSIGYQSAIDTLATNVEGAANQIANAAQLIADQALGDEYSAEAKVMAGNLYDDRYKEIYDEIIQTDATNNAKGDDSTTTSRDIWARFNAANGTNLVASKNQIQGNDNNRVYAYKGEKGEETYTIEYIAETIAAAEAMAELSGNADKANESLAHMTKTVGEDVSAGLKHLITEGNFENMSQNDRTAMFGQIDLDNNADLTQDEVLSYLRTAFNMTDEELAQVFNVETVDEVYSKWINAWDNGQKALNNAGDQLTKTSKEFFDSLNLDDLNVEEKNSLAGFMNEAFINAGKDGVQAFSDAFNAVSEGEDKAAFIESLESIDWKTAEVKDVRQAFLDAGVAIDITDEALQNMINSMNGTVIATLSSATENYAALHEIIDGLETGDTITAEQFEALGDGYEDYFMRMADGTYKLTHDAEEFYDIVNGKTLDEFKEVQADLLSKNATISGILNNGEFSLGADDKTGLTNFSMSRDRNNIEWANNKVQTQLDVLSIAGNQDAAQMREWQDALNEGTISTQEVVDIAAAVDDWTVAMGGAAEAEKYLTEQVALNEAQIRQCYEAIASGATSIEDLNELLEEGAIDFESYHKAWTALNEEADLEGLDTEALEDYADHLEETMDLSEDAAKIVAKSTMKMNDGVDELADNFEDWSDVLDNSTEASEEYFEALSGLRGAMSKLLDISGDYLSASFLTNAENMELMAAAAKGDAEAIDALRRAALEDIVLNLELSADSTLTPEGLWAKVQELQGMLDEMGDLTVGTEVDDSGFIAACNEMIAAAGLTSDQVNAMFDGMGYEATFASEPQSIQGYNTVTTTHRTVIPRGTYTTADGYEAENIDIIETSTSEKIPNETVVQAFGLDISPEGEATVPQIQSITKKATGASNNYSSSNSGGKSPGSSGGKSGGGDKKGSKNKGVKKDDIVDRYKEIEDSLDDMVDAMSDARKESDRLFGTARLNSLKKENNLIRQNIELLKEKKDKIEDNLEIDRKALKEAADAAGVTLDIDENNLITNYTEAMTQLFNELDAAHKAAGDTIEEAEQEIIDAIQEKIDLLKEAIAQFDETRELLEDTENEIQDAIYEWQDNNYEQLTYKLELEVIVNDNEMKELDYYFGKMEGDLEKAVEAFGILQDKMEVTKDSLKDYENHVNDLEAAYAAGEISQADYIDGLQECYDSLYDNLEALNELDKQMMEYYGETYDLALEKLDKYTSQLEHLNGVLDHYKSIMSLLGKETDFETMGVILEGQVETTRNSYEASKSIYEMAKDQKDQAYQELLNAKDDNERELLQKNYDKAVEEFNNAQEQMLSDAEAYGQAIKDVLVNSMEQAAKEMEEALTGTWGSFEALQEQMDLHSTRESEYLTTTNKLYETNKMLNQLAQDMEKTDNRAAKAKYAAFAKEIEQLQQKGKLSNLELEIAKAKYSVLQAQIALEEAKNAKSTVRLQRDSEGNFGYVYTADQDKIAQAEQDLADAENDLYNIRLDAANEYAEKLIQAKADLTARLKEIDERAAEDAEYREGQYAEDRKRILNEYYQTIEAYSELYNIATSEDARIVDEAWTSAYSDIIDQGEDWKDAITRYTQDITTAFEIWEQRTDVLTDLVGKNLDETKEKVDDVTSASEDLKNELKNEVIPTVSSTLTEVRKLTAGYAAQRTSVLNLAKAYETLAKKIKEAIKAEAQESGETTPTTQPETPQTETPTTPSEPESGNKLENASITTQKGVAYAVWNGVWGNGSARKTLLNQKFGDGAYETYQALVSQYDIASKAKGTGWITDLGWSVSDPDVIKKLQSTYGPSAFFTGGYTGEWGPNGKLAFLHEKELVLNAKDTENLLETITILRELMKAIDLNASWASMGIGLLNAAGVSNNNQILEQQVEIHAEFPNATDRYEIEEAFTSLVNRASQYAHRF